MTTPTGGQFIFARDDGLGVNVTLTPSGGTANPNPTPDFDLEVFTVSNPGTKDSGYDGSGFAPGGTLNTSPDSLNGAVQADSFIANDGSYWIIDLGGNATIRAGSGAQTITAGVGDTVFGGTGSLKLITDINNVVGLGSASSATVNAMAGKALINLGDNNATVIAGSQDTVHAGAGIGIVIVDADTVNPGNEASLTITGAAGAKTFDLAVAGVGPLFGSANTLRAVLGASDSIRTGLVDSATINALATTTAGSQNVVDLGTGPATVFAGAGDTVLAGAGAGLVIFGASADPGFAEISGVATAPVMTIAGAGGSFFVGATAIKMISAKDDSISIGTSTSATVNALSGNNLVNAAAGVATVFAGIDSTIRGGTGSVDVIAGSAAVTNAVATLSGAGSFGLEVQSGTFGTLSLKADEVNLISFGADTITASTSTVGGSVTINALDPSAQLINLGGGNATVFAGVADTIQGGAGDGIIVLSTGDNLTVSGPIASDNLLITSSLGSFVGSFGTAHLVAGGDETIVAGAGSQTINGVSDAGKQLIAISGGKDSVFGGNDDTIGVGATTPGSVGGSELWLHSGFSTDTVGFGTYNGDTTGTQSNVAVTVGTVAGSAASEEFNLTTDFLFYQNVNSATTDAIIAGATDTTVDTVASTRITMPDGTTMLLIGVQSTDLNAGLFREAPF